MRTTNEAFTDIKVVSIHDMNPRGVLSFDLLQILNAIEQSVREYDWIVSEIECNGETIPTGIVLSFTQLVDYAHRLQQTINGMVFGFPSKNLPSVNLESIARIRDLPRTPVRIAILAVDSSYFEVISKDLAPVEQIRQAFQDVRDQDPNNYFE